MRAAGRLYCVRSDLSGVRLGTETLGPGQARDFYNVFALPATPGPIGATVGQFPLAGLTVAGR